MNLSNAEIIRYVIDYFGSDNPNEVISFLKNDCNIDIQLKHSNNFVIDASVY